MKRLFMLCLLAGCKAHGGDVAQRVPATTGPIQLDGELGESDWSTHSLRHVLVAEDGGQARPFSEASLLHDKDYVYVGLYAADEDIRSDEFFDVHIGTLAFHANATGTVTPAIAGIKTSIDRDGTLDDASNDDEEWVLELAVPLPATGLQEGARLVTVKRCDTPKDHIQRCGSWSATVALQ